MYNSMFTTWTLCSGNLHLLNEPEIKQSNGPITCITVTKSNENFSKMLVFLLYFIQCRYTFTTVTGNLNVI